MVRNALKSKELKHAKLTEDSLKSFVSIWCQIKKELDHQRMNGPKTGKHDIKFLLPAAARKIVLPTSYWNLGKTGGDTLTRLFNKAEARGIGSKNNVAMSRIFMYGAATIHRLIQYTTAQLEVSDYQTLQVFQDTANHCTSMKKSLQTIAETLIGIGRKELFSAEEAVQLPLLDPSGPFEPSPMKEMTEDNYEDVMEDNGDTIRDEAMLKARKMPYAAAETSKSPKPGRGIDCVDEEFEKRCQQ